MALFDFLKKKKEIEKSKKPAEKKVEKVSVAKEKKEEKALPVQKSNKSEKFSYQVVKEPHISEKSTNLAEKNKYVFRVYKGSNKMEIKKSVEGIYGVDVLSVNIIKIPGKKRRLGAIEGFKKGHNKAVVTIKEGQKIEIL